MRASMFRLGVCAFAGIGAICAATLVKTVTLSRDFSGEPNTRFENGRLLARGGDHRTIRTFDAKGNPEAEFALSLPDATSVSHKSVASFPDGGLAIAATAGSREGAVSSVIVFTDGRGAIERIVRTTPFTVFHLAAGPDGSLWAVGREHDAKLDEVPDYDILRQYDRQGQFLRSTLRKSSFHLQGGKWHPAYESWLSASRGKVALYCVTAGELVEVSSSGEVIGRWGISGIPADAQITGLALTSTGAIYVSTQVRSAQQTPVYRLERGSGQFVQTRAVDLAPNHRGMSNIAGGDGDQVVFYAKWPTSLIWSRPE